MKMEQIDCSETSAYNIETPGNYPKENTLYSEHGESLKRRMTTTFLDALWRPGSTVQIAKWCTLERRQLGVSDIHLPVAQYCFLLMLQNIIFSVTFSTYIHWSFLLPSALSPIFWHSTTEIHQWPCIIFSVPHFLYTSYLDSELPNWVLVYGNVNFVSKGIYTGCPRRNLQDFGRVFLMLKYTDITQNTYIQSWTVTEIMTREVWNFDSCYALIGYQIHIKTGRNVWFL